MASESLSTFSALLKEHYTDWRVAVLVLTNAPLFAMMEKNETIGGETWDVPLLYGDAQAGSALFLTAQGNKTSSLTTKFQMTMADDYAFGAFTRKLIKASQSNLDAFLPGAVPQVDGALRTNRRSMGIQIYGSGSGSKGQIQAIDDTGTNGIITLGTVAGGAVRHEAVKWQKGEKIQLSTADGGGSLRDSGNAATILSVQAAAGTITVTGKLGTAISGAAADDFMFREGDYDAVITGVGGWIPASDPGATLHFGVDRTVAPEPLAGVRFDATGLGIIDGFIDGQSEVATIGDGMPDHMFTHPSQFRKLSKELGAKVELQRYMVNEVVGFQGLTVQGDSGEMRVIPDRYCQPIQAYPLQLDTWELGSLGMFPEIFDIGSAQEALREGASDGYEVRTGGYGNPACHAPGYNGNITLDVA